MNIKSCPTCSNPIPLAAPGGFCPTCLLREAAESLSTGQTAPSLEDVAIAFPALEILSLIGQGGMGAVYKVRQPSLDRIVALKILSPELSRDPAFAERFAREARVLGKLNHPNIVTVYEHGESGGYYFLIMEYVDGVNLRQAMRAGRFTPEQALSIVPGICDALQAAHAQGIWHRDIKPENILLDQRGGVKIADFGIAKLVEDQTKNFTLTGTGNALGSIAYMAPEQHESPHTVDHRADIYSLGVVIYEMLTGELPLGRFPAPSQRAAVSARIDEIVFQTLEKERELRQQSATEVKTDVQGATATKESTKTWANVPHPPSKQTLIALSLMLLGITLRFFGYEVVPNVYLPQHRIVLLSTTASVLIIIGESLLVFGYIWGLYSLWEMKRGLKPPVWRPLLECVTVIPILFRGLKWWSLHSPRSLRWTFALLLVVGPAIPLIYWLANDRPTVANSISANFYLWAILVLVAVFGGGKMIWTMILRPDCYPKRAYQVAFWVLALFCAGLAVWLQPLPEPTNSDAWQHTLAYGGICGAAGVSALALLFSPTRWGVVGLVLCSFVLGHDVFRSWAFPSKTDTTNVQALSPDSEAWSYTPRHMTSGEIETWIKSPQSQSNSPHSKNWNFAWTEEMKLQFDDGTVTLTGPKQNVRPLMSLLRMMDSIKVPPPGSTGNNFPPITLGTFVLMALIEGDHFDKAILGSALIKTFQDEKITPPQLARALQSHVLEFESATITGEQKPNSGKLNGLTDATVFEITVPCSDRNDRPLKLSLIEINFGFRKEHKLISLSPWLLEEAKKQSAEPFTKQAEEPKQTSAKSPDSVPFSKWVQGEWGMDREETDRARAELGLRRKSSQGQFSLHLRFSETTFESWKTEGTEANGPVTADGISQSNLPPFPNNPEPDKWDVTLKMGNEWSRLSLTKQKPDYLRLVADDHGEKTVIVFKRSDAEAPKLTAPASNKWPTMPAYDAAASSIGSVNIRDNSTALQSFKILQGQEETIGILIRNKDAGTPLYWGSHVQSMSDQLLACVIGTPLESKAERLRSRYIELYIAMAAKDWAKAETLFNDQPDKSLGSELQALVNEENTRRAPPSNLECEWPLSDPRIKLKHSLLCMDPVKVDDLPKEFVPMAEVDDPTTTSEALKLWMKEHKAYALGRVLMREGNVLKFGIRSFGMRVTPLDEMPARHILRTKDKAELTVLMERWGSAGEVHDYLTEPGRPLFLAVTFPGQPDQQGIMEVAHFNDEWQNITVHYTQIKGPPSAESQTSLLIPGNQFAPTLTDPNENPLSSLISFETGKVLPLKPEFLAQLQLDDPLKTSKSFIGYMLGQQADAVARVIVKDGKVAKYGLRTFGMWMRETTPELAKQVLLGRRKIHELDGGHTVLDVQDYLIEPGKTAVFVVGYNHRIDREGVLEITGLEENPRRVTLRYTTVSNFGLTIQPSYKDTEVIEPQRGTMKLTWSNGLSFEVLGVLRDPRNSKAWFHADDGLLFKDSPAEVISLFDQREDGSKPLPENEVLVYYRQSDGLHTTATQWSVALDDEDTTLTGTGRVPIVRNLRTGNEEQTVKHIELRDDMTDFSSLTMTVSAVASDAAWECVATFDGKETKGFENTKGVKVAFNLIHTSDAQRIEIQHNIPRDVFALRLWAKLKNGDMKQITRLDDSPRGDHPTQSIATIPKAEFHLDDVKELSLERTPLLRGKINRISMHPASR